MLAFSKLSSFLLILKLSLFALSSAFVIFFKVPLTNIIQNGTIVQSKAQVISHLGIGCVITPFVAFLETIAVAKTLSRKNNYKVDVTQELFSLGIVNVIGSFFSAFPVAGSFSRSALNSQCSVKTQLGGISILVLEPLHHTII